ncbi:MAG: YfgM family protein [Oceanobacter sp.]
MSELRTDEEQVEMLKRWWDENGKGLLVAVILVAGGWGGWNFYQENQRKTGEAAANIYQELMTSVGELDAKPSDAVRTEATALAEQLKSDFGGTVYSQFASLTLARIAAEKGDMDSAITELQAVKAADTAPFKYLASYRIGMLLIEKQDYDKALAEVASIPEGAEAYKSQYLEVRGDALMLKGDEAKARQAYLDAIDAAKLTGQDTRVLKRKADYLASSEDA